ncbi:MAG: hypothetical protein G01um101477_515 [Candidatus Doudnabacteria bacterium Gr01-1014_77]|uniref:Uncharacterized protein n=1 Tax=Candidatus Doudnabacteria bacterium Gr01-1014_77 TaxID=2017133 RepID=A0A554JAG4_9BACT|nr:MAG: hypothetical protein G01um101477_515 [Candidatus Doudnabacteria bacterium Gr01-1014_77]
MLPLNDVARSLRPRISIKRALPRTRLRCQTRRETLRFAPRLRHVRCTLHSPHEVREVEHATDPNRWLSGIVASRCLADRFSPRDVRLIDGALGLLRSIHDDNPPASVVNLNPAIDDDMLRGNAKEVNKKSSYFICKKVRILNNVIKEEKICQKLCPKIRFLFCS